MSKWITSGRVNLTTGSRVVTGVGTTWVGKMIPGSIFISDDRHVYEAEEIISNVELRLASNYTGASISNVNYAAAPTQAYLPELAERVVELLGIFGTLKNAWEAGELNGQNFVILGSKPTVGDLPASNNKPGSAWLVGDDAYTWTGTEWFNTGPIHGPKGDTGDVNPLSLQAVDDALAAAALAFDHKQAAAASATAAATAATTATTKAGEAVTSATTATTKATEASVSATAAASSATLSTTNKDAAASSATAAAGSATAAAASATAAQGFRDTAETYKDTAGTSATAAAGSATAAAGSATAAAGSATAAQTHAATALTHAGTAGAAATTAQTAKTEAQGFATDATAAATAAATAKTGAETAQTAAGTQAGLAATSAGAAATAKTNAESAAAASEASKVASGASATASAGSATASDTARAAAVVAQLAAEEARDQAEQIVGPSLTLGNLPGAAATDPAAAGTATTAARSDHSHPKATLATVTGLEAALEDKADLVGGKVPVEQLPPLVQDIATVVMVDNAPETVTEVTAPDVDNTLQESLNLLAGNDDFLAATITSLAITVGQKAPQSTTYTISEVDSRLGDKVDLDGSGHVRDDQLDLAHRQTGATEGVLDGQNLAEALDGLETRKIPTFRSHITTTLNAALAAGTYSFAGAVTGAPSGVTGGILIAHTGTTNHGQFVLGSNGKVFARVSVGSSGTTWANWQEYASVENMESALSVIPYKADLLSPTFVGEPYAPSAAEGTNTDQIATTLFVTRALNYLYTKANVDALLLNKLDTSTATGLFAAKAGLNSPTFTGDPKVPFHALNESGDLVVNVDMLLGAISGISTLNNIDLTGVVTVPTAAAGSNSTRVANTAWVKTTLNSFYVNNGLNLMVTTNSAPTWNNYHDFNYQNVYRMNLRSPEWFVGPLGTASTVSLQRTNSSYHNWAPVSTGNATATVGGWPTSGNMGEFQLAVTNLGAVKDAGYSVTFIGVTHWLSANGSTFSTPEAAGISWKTSGVDFVKFWSSDGGTTVYAEVMAGAKAFNRLLSYGNNTPTPALPLDQIELLVRNNKGRTGLGFSGASRQHITFQEALYGINQFTWMPIPGTATFAVSNGAPNVTFHGTATAHTPGYTFGGFNLRDFAKRVNVIVGTAATNAVAGVRLSAGYWTVGVPATNSYSNPNTIVNPGGGGFTFFCRFSIKDGATVSTMRGFVGMAIAGAASDVEPSTRVNMVGFGWDSTDANIQLMRNDGSGTATKIDLGSSFPVPSFNDDSIYEAYLHFEPGVTSPSSPTLRTYSLSAKRTAGYSVSGDQTSAEFPDAMVSGTIPNSDLPVFSTMLAPVAAISVGGTSSTIAMSIYGMGVSSTY